MQSPAKRDFYHFVSHVVGCALLLQVSGAPTWASQPKVPEKRLVPMSELYASSTRGAPRELPPDPPALPARTAFAGAAPEGAAAGSDGALVPGFNLVSIPNEPADTDPATVLAPIAGQYSVVYAYDACDPDDPWKIYDPADPAASDLAAIDHRIGFWLDAGAAVALPAAGTLPERTTIELCRGWNLIGYPLAQARPVRSALYSIEGRYSLVFGYDASDPDDPWEVFSVAAPDWGNDLQTMTPGRGYWVLATEDVTLDLANAGPPPAVAIASPLEASVLTTFTDVLGTVDSALLDHWELSYRPAEGPEWARIAAGTAPISSHKLGVFDPTLLLNDLYEIRLRARDFQGRVASSSVQVVVDGGLKLGNFTLPLLDFEMEALGLPIQVVRTYDSRDKRKSDFGFGWTLTLSDVRVRENVAPGLGWKGVRIPGTIPQYCIEPTRAHLVTVVFPGGETLRFRPTPVPACQQAAPPRFVTIGYEPLPGTLSRLVPLDHQSEGLVVGEFPGPVEIWNPRAGTVHNAATYKLITPDNRILVIGERDGLTKLTAANGNSLRFTITGIEHSGGHRIHFERDAENRITKIRDPLGNAITYGYDENGDLVEFTDQNEQVTHFTYFDDHYLHKIILPGDRELVAAEYDGDRRLIRSCDTTGQCGQLIHNLEESKEIQVDATGRITGFTYDERGNVVAITNGLGYATRFEYDANDRPIKGIDPLGHVTVRRYDERGNLLAVTVPHPEGAATEEFTTHFTYDDANRPTSVTSPTGARIDYRYDGAGNLTEMRDELGNLLFGRTYSSSGELLAETTPFTAVSYSDFTPLGEPRRMVDPGGDVSTALYDANGNLTNLVEANDTSIFTFDGKGRRVREDYGTADVVELSYDLDDLWVSSESPILGRVERLVDSGGLLTGWKWEPDGQILFARDAAGRLTDVTDAAGNSTRTSYDAAGRIATQTAPNGATLRLTYDPAGRLVEQTDALGNTTRFGYTPNGLLSHLSNARGATWTMQHAVDSVAITDPLGRTTTRFYSSHGLPRKTVYPDGSSSETEFLLTSLLVEGDNYPTRIRDSSGRERTYTYDEHGRLVGATDRGGVPYTYSNEAGLVSTISDPSGDIFSFGYDDQGRLIEKLHPDRSTTTFEYDSEGLSRTTHRPSGTVVTETEDRYGNVINRRSSLGEAETFTWSHDGQLLATADVTGTTRYAYDELGLLAQVVHPDGASVTYERDLLGRVKRLVVQASPSMPTYMTEYLYDSAGNLTSLLDPLGGITTFTFDSANRLIERKLPNDVISVFEYDELDRIVGIVHKNAAETILASVKYQRQGIGEPVRITYQDGSYVEMTYDDALRLTGEIHHDKNGIVQEHISYSYDTRGNRLTRTNLSGSISYNYQGIFQLTAADSFGARVTYRHDVDGRLALMEDDSSITTFTYDSRDRLAGFKDAGSGLEVSYQSNASGWRVRAVSADDERRFIIAPTMGEGLPSTHMIADRSGALRMGYVYAGELPLLRFDEQGPIYYLTDAMGSTIALTDAKGTRVAEFRFEAFGSLLTSSGSHRDPPAAAGGDYRMHGAWLETSTNLYHLRSREYDHRTGRFLTPDPAPPHLGAPENLHPYAFVTNNPHLYRDPDGRFQLISLSLTQGMSRALNAIHSYVVHEVRQRIKSEIGRVLTERVTTMLSEYIGGFIGRVANLAFGGSRFQTS